MNCWCADPGANRLKRQFVLLANSRGVCWTALCSGRIEKSDPERDTCISSPLLRTNPACYFDKGILGGDQRQLKVKTFAKKLYVSRIWPRIPGSHIRLNEELNYHSTHLIAHHLTEWRIIYARSTPDRLFRWLKKTSSGTKWGFSFKLVLCEHCLISAQNVVTEHS